MNICGIYKITNPIGKIYIGQSVDISKRWKEYKRRSRTKGQILLHRSILKHGYDKHNFEVIESCDKDELNDKEIYYIDLFQSFNSKHGLNLTSGGKCCRLSEESKRKISISLKGKNTWSKGTKKSEAEKAKRRAYRHTAEAKEKIGLKASIARKGRSQSGRLILNINTGIYYYSAMEAIKTINIKYPTFISQLSGANPNKTNFIYT